MNFQLKYKRFNQIQVIAFFICLGYFTSNCQGQGYEEVSQAVGVNHIQNAPMLMGGGAAFIDYNLDGYEDLYFTGGIDADKLYRNNGDGTFTDVTNIAGIVGTDTVNTMGVVVGDLDNDGDKEIFITSWDGYHNLLFLNNGNGTFQDISLAAGINDTALSISATMGDVNKDGLLDIYVGNYIDLSIVAPNGFDYTCYANFLYINAGSNTFVDSALAYGVADTGCALAVAFTDYDAERDVDLYIANDFGKWVRPNALFNNSFPTSSFGDSTLPTGVNDSIFGMGIAIGDYDEDGDLDYYITNLGRNVLRKNQGNGTFIDFTDSAAVTNTYTDSTFYAVGWGTAFYDYDNDTYLDLVVSNGYIPADSFIYNSPNNPNVLYRNPGNGVFQDVSDVVGFNDTTFGRGLAIGDYNYDGAIDIVVGVADADTSSGSHSLIYTNKEQGNNWLKLSLQGVNTNRNAYGSQISIFSGGRKFIREIDGGSSHISHSSSIAHFGMGNLTVVDSIRVSWLNGGSELLVNVAVNQQIHIIEDSLFYTIHYQNPQICPGDSTLLGGTFQFLQGIYSDTLISVFGYDSIIHSSLTYIPFGTDTILSAICTGDSIFAGGAFQYTSGTYIDTLMGFSCDSLVITELTVSSIFLNSISDSVCNGDLYLGVSYSNDTVLIGNYVAANGCDSTVTTTLTVLQVSTGVLDTVICEGNLYLGSPYYLNTTLLDTFMNSLGCDSVLTTNIQVLLTDTLASGLPICEGDSINGQSISSDTIFVSTYLNSAGCDSTEILYITVLSDYFANTNISVDWGDTVKGIVLFTDTIIVESYVSINGCDSIEQYTITVGTQIGLDKYELLKGGNVSCYPNPFTSSVSIEFSLSSSDQGRLVVSDLLGREVAVIYNGTFRKGNQIFTWNGTTKSGRKGQSGMYLCTLIISNSRYSVPLIHFE